MLQAHIICSISVAFKNAMLRIIIKLAGAQIISESNKDLIVV